MKKQMRQWEKLGAKDPYWAVLTLSDKKNGGWEKDEFFQTGEIEIRSLFSELSGKGIDVESRLALDFGCGVGRLTRALAGRFTTVVGVDFSSAMLDEARSVNEHLYNVEFIQIPGDSLGCIEDSTVDFIYSSIALQHSPRKIQEKILNEFFRVLSPSGIAVFQTPSAQNLTIRGLTHRLFGNRILNVFRGLRYGRDCVMEIHPINAKAVEKIIEKAGAVLLYKRENRSAGDSFLSFRYVVRR